MLPYATLQPAVSGAATDLCLDFRTPDPALIPYIRRIMARAASCRTCDYTVGGLYMWADYFNYETAIAGNTLFMRGVVENNRSCASYMMPVGDMPLPQALQLLHQANGPRPLIFTAVPQSMLDALLDAAPGAKAEIMDGWADYLYDINAMSTFAGKKLAKKRNHVNRFRADHPDAVAEPLTAANIPDAMTLLNRLHADDGHTQAAYLEMEYAMEVLRQMDTYDFEGLLLRTAPGAPAVAFTLGEVMGDTLHCHIEKMDHTVNGSGETVSSLFCAMMLDRHPGLAYVNREDAAGDPGLMRAKQAYQPLRLLDKYNVTV